MQKRLEVTIHAKLMGNVIAVKTDTSIVRHIVLYQSSRNSTGVDDEIVFNVTLVARLASKFSQWRLVTPYFPQYTKDFMLFLK